MKIALGVGGAAILAVAALWWRLDAVSSQRDTALAERDKALHGLEIVLSERDRVDSIVSALNDRLDAIRADSRQTRQAINELERSNEEIRSFLDTPIPDDLARIMWPDPSAPSDSVGASTGNDAPVRGQGNSARKPNNP